MQIKTQYTKDELISIIDEVCPTVEFRKYQRATIIAILNEYMLDNNAKIILDAPTGSGKSIIALVTSRVLSSKYFSKRGYILTSDTLLQEQYEDTTILTKIPAPSIMGIDRYDCNKNQLPTSLGECKEEGLKVAQIKELSCYATCQYYAARNKAASASIAVMNYNYWLIQQNYVGDHGPFDKRDFCFFDESHKVVSLVNEHFSPRISRHIIKNSDASVNWLKKNTAIKNSDLSYIHTQIDFHVDSIMGGYSPDFNNLYELEKNLEKLVSYKELFSFKKTSNEATNKSNRKALRAIDAIKDIHCKIEDFVNIVSDDPDNLMVRAEGLDEVKFYAIEEGKMMESQFHQYYNFGVYMSATFLNHDFFANYSNMKGIKVLKIPNTFDFSKSPIYYSKKYNMSYHQKEASRPGQAEEIKQIVSRYPSGVIHTGSYDNSSYLENYLSDTKNIKYYRNTSEKKELLYELSRTKDFFIAGPSLIEGVDLKGDMSRCQIFMKIPFLNLGDNFTKKRMEKNSRWYQWESALRFVQGIGRSNRFEDDYSATYILDSTFARLLQSKMIPAFITERIEII